MKRQNFIYDQGIRAYYNDVENGGTKEGINSAINEWSKVGDLESKRRNAAPIATCFSAASESGPERRDNAFIAAGIG